MGRLVPVHNNLTELGQLVMDLQLAYECLFFKLFLH
jgi:hypothetical protein